MYLKACAPLLPVAFLCQRLVFHERAECDVFLRRNGAVIVMVPIEGAASGDVAGEIVLVENIDTKQSLMKISSSSSRVSTVVGNGGGEGLNTNRARPASSSGNGGGGSLSKKEKKKHQHEKEKKKKSKEKKEKPVASCSVFSGLSSGR